MKKWFLLLVIILTTQAYSKESAYTCDRIDSKIVTFSRMKTAGLVLLGASAMGGVMAFNLMQKGSRDNEGGGADGLEGFQAIFLIELTVLGGVAGGILTGIGARKEGNYRRMLEDENCSVFLNPVKRQIGLAYRF